MIPYFLKNGIIEAFTHKNNKDSKISNLKSDGIIYMLNYIS